MPAQLIFTHETIGAYEFPQEKIPLISRRVTAQRTSDQGGGHRRIDITFNGYFTANSHTLIMAKQAQLIDLCNAHQLKVFYNDGTNIILNNQLIYMEGIGEPEQWRQRLGDYSISGYYFEKLDDSWNDLVVSYSSVAGSFQWEQLPVLGISSKRARSSALAHETLPSGTAVGTEVSLQVAGELCESTHGDLITARANMELALSRDGTLNYGGLSFACRVNQIQWAPYVPSDFWPFMIDFTYFLSGITNFECLVNYSRITLNPIIHENPNCPNEPIVVNRFNQGQWVDYSFHIEGLSLIALRTALLNEFNFVVAPNGYEPAGGKEAHNLQEPKIDLNFTKFYKIPILNNIEGNP